MPADIVILWVATGLCTTSCMAPAGVSRILLLAVAALVSSTVLAGHQQPWHAVTVPSGGVSFSVSPAGSDSSGDGFPAKPFRTLQRAQLAVHQARGNTSSPPALINVAKGRYELHAGAAGGGQLALAGEKDSNIVVQGGGAGFGPSAAVLTGGRLVNGPWTPCSNPSIPEGSRGHVFCASLAEMGLTAQELGSPGTDNTQFARVTVDMEERHLARWPNADAAGLGNWTVVSGVPASVSDGSTIEYNTSRPARWINSKQGMLHGFFHFFWRDHHATIESINTTARTITCTSAIGQHEGTSPNTYYYAYNLLEELDSAGEYFIDRMDPQLTLYVFQESGLAPAENSVEISLSTIPIISVVNVTNAVFRGIGITMGQSEGLQAQSSASIVVEGSHFSHLAGIALQLGNGTGYRVTNNSISYVNKGVEVEGGTRYFLKQADIVVEDNEIHHFGRWVYSYSPAVGITGDGIVVRNNYFHDAPHTALLLGGNNHVISGNHFKNVVLQGYDSGAIYTDNDWTYRGNVISENLFQNIGKVATPCNSYTSCIRMAVYVDDHTSGFLVSSNVFLGVQTGFFSHLGRDDTLVNNMFIDVDVSARLSGSSSLGSKNATLLSKLHAMPFQDAQWSAAYPRLAIILQNHPALPLGHNLTCNIAVNVSGPTGWQQAHNWPMNVQGWASADPTWNYTIGANLLTKDPGFVSPMPASDLDFQLADSSTAFKMGWRQLPSRFGPSWSIAPYRSQAAVQIAIDTSKVVHTTRKEYMSFDMDWWTGEHSSSGGGWAGCNLLAVDLENRRLNSAAAALAPAYLRMGGSLDTVVRYNFAGPDSTAWCNESVSFRNELWHLCLNESRWDAIAGFAARAGIEIVMGLTYGNSLGGASLPPWNVSESSALLKYSHSKGYKIAAVELGEELAPSPGSTSFKNLLDGYKQLAQLVSTVYSDSKPPDILGPCVGMADEVPGKQFAFMEGFLNTTLGASPQIVQGICMHSYNNDGGDNWKHPGFLDQTKSQAEGLLAAIARASNGHPVPLWCGECGPHNGGGIVNVTNRAMSSFWYLDALGGLARLGLVEFGRQSLVGSHYGLLECDDEFSPNPDFWTAWQWTTHMGQHVLDVQGSTDTLHMYAHCAPESQLDSSTVSVAFVNIGNESVVVDLSLSGHEAPTSRQEYHFSTDDLLSRTVSLNGQVLAMDASGTLPTVTPKTADPNSPMTVNPLSWGFVELKGAAIAACKSA